MLVMPTLRPLPISTLGRPWYARLWIWWTSTRRWEVVEDWYFKLPDNMTIIIPAGFVFDGASIPRPLWWVLSPVGLLLIPGLVHDFAYRYGYLLLPSTHPRLRPTGEGFGRRHWDRLFRDVATQVNGLTVISPIAYYLLRLGAWPAWRAHRRMDHL